MSNPKTVTTPKHSNDDKVINVELLQRNKEDCNQTLEILLSCMRNPTKHLGERVFLTRKEHFAKDMQTLEKIGYVRNSKQQCFELPQKPKPCPFKSAPGSTVQLADNDPKFMDKMTWLENNDYTRNADKNCWELDTSPALSLKLNDTSAKVLNFTKGTTAVAFVLVGSAVGLFFKTL